MESRYDGNVRPERITLRKATLASLVTLKLRDTYSSTTTVELYDDARFGSNVE